jgi:hypothetical protein
MWAVGKPVERPTDNNVNPSFPQFSGRFRKISSEIIHGKT